MSRPVFHVKHQNFLHDEIKLSVCSEEDADGELFAV